MELSSSYINKNYSMSGKGTPPPPSPPTPQKIKLLYFLKIKLFLCFRKRKPKKLFIFHAKFSKFSKLKYFLIIIIKHFFSFYNIFFYRQKAFIFHLLKDFCNAHDHFVAFFLLQKDFDIFHELFFVVFLYFLDNIQLADIIYI